MAAPSDEGAQQAEVERRAAGISGGIINAVDTVAAIGSLFVGVVEPTLAAEDASGAEESGEAGVEEDELAAAAEAEGLSIEEMMARAREQLGDAEPDAESDAALRAAFEALKELENTQPAAPAGAKLKSGVLRGAASLGFELRSFLEGAKRELEGVQNRVVDKVKLDATLAARAADWVVRRAILDSGRVLGAAASTLALGAGKAAPAEDKAAQEAAQEAEGAAPFASRLSSLDDAEEGRSGGLLLGAAPVEDRAAEVAAAEAARREQGGEALKQTAERLRGAAEFLQGKPVELEASEVAVRAAGELGVLLERSRRDFESFDALAARGQLPTLGEEVRGQLPDWVTRPLSERQARGLGAFEFSDAPSEQRRRRQQRRQLETETQRLKLAAALAGRASKDSSDAMVFGVLPAARAAAKVATRRAVQEYGAKVRSGALPELPGVAPPAAASGPSARPGAGGLLAEVTAELVQEYGEGLRVGVESGVLPDVQGRLGKVAEGATRKLGGLQGKLQGALPGGLQSRLQGGLQGELPASPLRSAEGQAPVPPSADDAVASDAASEGVATPVRRKPWRKPWGARAAGEGAARDDPPPVPQGPSEFQSAMEEGWRRGGEAVEAVEAAEAIEAVEAVEAVETVVEVVVEAEEWVASAGQAQVEVEVEVETGTVAERGEAVAVEVEVLGAEVLGAESTDRRGGGWGFGAAAQQEEPREEEEWSYTAGAWRREATPGSEASWGAAADVGVGVEVEASVEVEVEVEAVASRDEGEEAREQLLSLVDAALFSGELLVSTVVGRTKATVLPDEAKAWSILKSFDDEVRQTDQRAAQIEGEVLDTLAKLVKRK